MSDSRSNLFDERDIKIVMSLSTNTSFEFGPEIQNEQAFKYPITIILRHSGPASLTVAEAAVTAVAAAAEEEEEEEEEEEREEEE